MASAAHTSSASLPWSPLLLSGRSGPGLQWPGGGSFGGELGEVRPRPGWLVSPVTRGPGEFPLLSPPGFLTRPPLSRKITPLFPACAPPAQGLPPYNAADSTPGLELGSVRWEPRLREAKGTLPALRHHPGLGRRAGNRGGRGEWGCHPWLLPLPQTPHPQLFPPLQAAGLGREQRLEQGQEAGSGAAGNAGSGGEGGEQGPGLLFHFFWKENWRKNRRLESPPPRPSGNPPQAGAGSEGP